MTFYECLELKTPTDLQHDSSRVHTDVRSQKYNHAITETN